MTMITPSYLGETIEYSSLHACRSTLEDPTERTDKPVVDEIAKSASREDYKFVSIVTAIVNSRPFRMRTRAGDYQ